MPQIINTNLASLNAQRNLNSSQSDQTTAMQRLSSGLRINSAKDDAAGLAISTRFDTQVRGLNIAMRNANDGVSLAQVAEGALGAITNNLQRIRELALQSANDTNSDLDRISLDAEVQQLIEEIGNVADTVSFNGRKLLDGSFTNATFQTGANVGETIDVDIAETSIDTLGTSTNNGISSTRDTSLTAIVAGDIVLNGIAVGATTALDDTASTINNDASAIAVAAAINRSSETSGVTATVNANTLSGDILAIASGANAVTINGVAISITTDATNASTTQASLTAAVNAINAEAERTGVRAETSTDPDAGVTLIADDGRNIQLTGASAEAGLAAPGVYSGTYTLVSRDGSPIQISTDTGNIDSAGMAAGIYSGANSGAVGTTNADLAAAVAMDEGDLVINGVPISAALGSYDTASTAEKDKSSISIAAAINAVSESTGVTAAPAENRIYATAVPVGATDFDINGVQITSAVQTSAGLQTIAIVDAVNAVAGQTGVSAELVTGDTYALIAADGRNIDFADNGANATITDGVHGGAVTLISGGQIELGSNTGLIENSRFESGVYGGGDTGALIKDLDVLTVANAEMAIISIDNAIQSIAVQRANLGAIQNRFEAAIENQSIASENMTAANSRIKDADFATETARLSRSQVLQQAGISILGQANALPQQVLSLLQG